MYNSSTKNPPKNPQTNQKKRKHSLTITPLTPLHLAFFNLRMFHICSLAVKFVVILLIYLFFLCFGCYIALKCWQLKFRLKLQAVKFLCS